MYCYIQNNLYICHIKQIFNLFNGEVYKNLKLSCIYKLSTPCNNLCYIGSTLNFAKRMKDHRNDLKNNKHVSKHMQNVINKYGLTCITEILEIVEEDILLKKEKYYIKKYNPKYNTIKDPTTQINNPGTSKKIYQYDLDGNYLQEWKSVNSVNRKLNIQVSPALNKEQRSAGNFQWRTYKINKIKQYKPNQGIRNLIHIYDILGNYIESLTMNDIKLKYYNDLSIQQVRNRVNTLCKTSKSINKLRFSKFLAKQLDNSVNTLHKKGFIILQYDLKMNYIEAYDSIEDAQKTLGLNSIYDNIIGKTRLVNKQYIFKILNGPVI